MDSAFYAAMTGLVARSQDRGQSLMSGPLDSGDSRPRFRSPAPPLSIHPLPAIRKTASLAEKPRALSCDKQCRACPRGVCAATQDCVSPAGPRIMILL